MTQPLSTPAAPGLVTEPDQLKNYAPVARQWQGIPGIERANNGRLWATLYTGGPGEGVGNVCLLLTSDDEGNTWQDPIAVATPPENGRCFDPVLWIDPLGRLWWFWSQAENKHYDGRGGVWAAILDDPTQPKANLSEPRRIEDGIMMNKPTVASNGDWLFPIAVWSARQPVLPEMADKQNSGCIVSTDQGKTFTWRGGVNECPDRQFDEHMFVELSDGKLAVFIRCAKGIARSVSSDGGKTWQEPAEPSGITGPGSRFYIRRLRSGNLLLIYHGEQLHAAEPDTRRRNLSAWVSKDDGQSWSGPLMLDAREPVSYPDATEGEDGRIFATYDYARGDKHWRGEGDPTIYMAEFTEADVLAGQPGAGTRLQTPITRATGGGAEAKS